MFSFSQDHSKKDQSCVTTMRLPLSCATMVLVWSRLDSPVMMLPVPSFPRLLADPVTRWASKACLVYGILENVQTNWTADYRSNSWLLYLRVWWSAWVRKTAMWEMRLRARGVSSLWNIPSSTASSPTGMTWRRWQSQNYYRMLICFSSINQT